MPYQSPSIDQSLCVFCGSAGGNHSRYMKLAAQTGHEIAAQGYRLVYGGGMLGLMGATAKAAYDAGGDVLGIIPNFLKAGANICEDIPHDIVPDMHTRKKRMYEASSAFIALPGGIGTLEEAIEIISWMRLDLHKKPIIFLDDDEYWLPMIALIDHTIKTGFSPDGIKEHIFHATEAKEAIDIARRHIEGAG